MLLAGELVGAVGASAELLLQLILLLLQPLQLTLLRLAQPHRVQLLHLPGRQLLEQAILLVLLVEPGAQVGGLVLEALRNIHLARMGLELLAQALVLPPGAGQGAVDALEL